MRRQEEEADADARGAATAPGSGAAPVAALPPGLSYVNDTMPGIRRVRRGAAFAYRDAAGRWLSDHEQIERIRRLAIPPAYSDVWICARDNGHLQATGRDARGRKQYRYHARWRSQRDDDKFARLEAFGRALPRIRARVARDLGAESGRTPSRDGVLAAIVRLLDTTCVRVGNDEYAQSNGSYGLTTLRNEHAGVRGSVLRLRFRGKSGTAHDVSIDDRRVAALARRCQELPGQELFGYVDRDGRAHDVGSSDVNDYLHEAAGGDERFTAKDFRTWHGSVQALELARLACLRCDAEAATARMRSSALKPIVAEVAMRLRNTVAVCRKSYIHPAVLEFCTRLDEAAAAAGWSNARARRGLAAAEVRLLSFLAQAKRSTLADRLERSVKKSTATPSANRRRPA